MEVHNQARTGARNIIDHLSTDEELGIEEIPRKKHLPADPAKPVVDIPLTGVSVCPLDGIVVVGEAPGSGEHGKKTANRFQRQGL
jgi:hypothetical protein